MDQIRAMRVFLRVAERGSLTLASEDLGYARGAASAIVKELEQYLGVQLLERTTRRLRLTEEGQLYAERATAILADIEALQEEVGGAERQARGLLRVQIPPGMANRILAPALPGFLARHPGIEVQLVARNSLPDFVADRLDAAVFVGSLPDSGLVARPIGRIPVITAAAPDYLSRNGTPERPEDLGRHNCLAILSSTNGLPVSWKFRRQDDLITVQPRGNAAFEGSDAAVAAAVRGLGIVQLASYLVFDEIRSGALTPVLAAWQAPAVEANILHPRHRLKPKKLRVFEDFLIGLNERVRQRWNVRTTK